MTNSTQEIPAPQQAALGLVSAECGRGKAQATVILVVVTVLWGLSFPLMKTWQEAATECPGGDLLAALTLISLRMILALVVLGLFQRRLFTAPNRRENATGALIGFVFGLGFILQVWGLGRTSPALSAFLTSLACIWAPLLALVCFRIRIAPITLLGLVVGFGGAALLESTSAQAWRPQGGESLTVASSLLFAGQILLLDRLGQGIDSAHLTMSFFATAGLTALLAAVALTGARAGFGPWLTWTASMLHSRALLANVAMLTLFSTVLAFHWMNTYQPRVSAARAALIYLLEPVFASIFSLLLHHDQLTLHLVLGGGLILGGNLLVELASWLRRPIAKIHAMSDYARREHHDFPGASRHALADPPLQAALVRLTDTLMAGNRRGYAALADSDRLRDHAKCIKEHTLAHLDRYLEQLETSVHKQGGHVHWASTAEEARQVVLAIARRADCRRAVKSKSMTAEEIHLNPALAEAGIEVTETDFGEYIIQLAGERPSHLVAPAVHHTRESIGRILAKHQGAPLPDDAAALALAGRRALRAKFHQADLGITGANFAVAETGTIALVTNEGNGRLTTTCPRVHIALMGIEKVIPRLVDLPVFLKLLARAATGQTLSVYTTLITGPRRPGELDGPEEFHLVILDNGRSKVLATPFRESLQCIRCGACLNACPVYRRIGGHAYGGVYSGPIGSILTPLYDSVAGNPHLPHASSLCGACQAACPVRINIPHMLIGLRELQHHARPNRWECLAYRLWKEVLRRPRLYSLALRCARFVLRPLARDGWLRWLPGPAGGWTAARDFPAPAARSFRERWQELQQ